MDRAIVLEVSKPLKVIVPFAAAKRVDGALSPLAATICQATEIGTLNISVTLNQGCKDLTGTPGNPPDFETVMLRAEFSVAEPEIVGNWTT